MKKFVIIIITILMSVVTYAQDTKTIDFNSLNWGFRDNMIYRLENEGKVVFQHNYIFNNNLERFAISDSVFLALYDHYEKNGCEVENAVKSLYEKAEKKYSFIFDIDYDRYKSIKREKISDVSMDDLDYIKWYDSLIKRYGKSFVEKLERIKDIYWDAKWVENVGISSFQMKFSYYDLLKKSQEQVVEENFDEKKLVREFWESMEEEFNRPIRIKKMFDKYDGKYYDFVIYPKDKCEKFIKEYKYLVHSIL